MHWEVAEALTLLAGVTVVVCSPIVCLADATGTFQKRLLAAGIGVGAGVICIAYAISMADQTSGIIFVPVGAWAGAGVVVALLIRAFQQAGRERANPPVPIGTPGARQCLKCGQAFPAGMPGPCPACQGTLAPVQGEEGRYGQAS